MRFHAALKLFALAFVLAFVSAGVAHADSLYATIRGQVTDQTKAAVPGAQVVATNTGTNEARTVMTQADGSFEFLNLPIGSYTISVKKAGFQSYVANGITLTVNQIYVLNPLLQVGAASQTVTVEAARTQVETTSMQLGTTVEASTIVDMPLNGRNWVQLQQLQPGVVGQSDRFGSNYATNGSQSQQNSYLINGTDSNDLPLNSPIVLPSPDAIQEFRMITNTINPEYGRNSGAILDAVIKSGTNHFHGDAFEFYRDTFLNNRNYFQTSRPVFHQNQFGGTIGGPIWKDHTFAFFSYQGTRNAVPQAGFGNQPVYTTAELQGQFNAAPDIDKKTGLPFIAESTKLSAIPEFGDSASTCKVSGGVMCPAGTPYSSLFSTGVIPTQDFNALSTALVAKYVPAANCNGGTQFCFNPSTAAKTNQYLGQINQNIGEHDTLWFYGFYQGLSDTNTIPFIGANLPGFGSQDSQKVYQFTFAENHIFSANTLNEFRVAYTRFNFQAVLPQTNTPPSSLGFQINSQITSAVGAPVIGVQNLFTLGFSNDGPQPRIDQTKQITDNFSHIVGRHTLKFGFEGRDFWVTNPFGFLNNGNYGFNNTGTFSTGDGGADFLLGIPASYAQSSGGFIDARAKEAYLYAQDEFKLRPTLTLTYGMGYQVDTPLKDIFNNGRAIDCFRPGQQSTIFPTAPTGMVFPGDANCSTAGYSTKWNDFGPRVGFAYAPNWGRISGQQGMFSIRGGIGMYYNRSEEEVTLQNLTLPPFQIRDSGIADVGGSPAFAAPFTDVHCIGQSNASIPCTVATPSIPNKYPFTAPAAGASINFATFEPMRLTVIDPTFRTPMAYNYNLTVQRQLPGQIILSVGYVGAMGRHELGVVDQNPGINPLACAADPVCLANKNIQREVLPTDFRYSATNPTDIGKFGPVPVFGGIGQMSTILNSNYNSLQVSANKALSRGLDFLVSYTWSHSLDYGSSFENASFGPRGLNPFNIASGYGDSSFDARQRLVVSYDYRIPGIEHLGAMHWMPNRIADGWHLSGITTLQTGFPIFTSDSGLTSLTCDNFTSFSCWDAPNVSGPVQTGNPRNFVIGGAHNYYFNPAPFSHSAPGVIGDAGRSFFHGPGINNWDLALMKDTKITESTSFELRMDFFNIFNHTQFVQNTSSSIVGDFNSVNFGREFNAANGRLIQLAAKFYF
ncbi:MAG: carboxypeptidase-like regulatory domain-containing protein [Candidatus Acidiferrales bacterium]